MVSSTEFKSPYYNLKSLIERKNMTQLEVAKKIGMDRTTFNLKINRTKAEISLFKRQSKSLKF